MKILENSNPYLGKIAQNKNDDQINQIYNDKKGQNYFKEDASSLEKIVHFMRTIAYYKRYVDDKLNYDKLCDIIKDDKLRFKFHNLQRSVHKSNET